MTQNPQPLAASGMNELVLALLTKLPEPLATALQAAVVPHWFDEKILAVLLDVSPDESTKRLAVLEQVSFVRQTNSVWTIHEVARAVILNDLWQNHRANYCTWSERAAHYFDQLAESNADSRLRIESIYNLCIANPDRAADEIWNWGAEWNNTFLYRNYSGQLKSNRFAVQQITKRR